MEGKERIILTSYHTQRHIGTITTTNALNQHNEATQLTLATLKNEIGFYTTTTRLLYTKGALNQHSCATQLGNNSH